MTLLRAGSTVDYVITYLEMTERPTWPWPPAPAGMEGALLRADAPPPWYFLAMYDAVGRDYAWTDHHDTPEDDLRAWLLDPEVAMYTLMAHGWPHGFFVLDGREDGVCNLAYFGLVPQVIGQGLGRWLLRTAILTGWARDGVTRMTVNTNTLDHPRALANYQKHGFTVVARETQSRVLTRDRDPARIPD